MDKLAIFGGEKIRNEPFVNYAIFGEEEKRRVSDVLDKGILSGFIASAGEHFLGGEQLKEFESLVKSYFSVDYVVAINSATAALHAAVGALGIGPGDEVIVTPYSMCASATAVVMNNAVPVFVDIEEDTFALDPKKIEERITKYTKAIILVHLFGYPAKMDQILEICKKYNLKLIEDCAQAPGAIHKDKLVGTLGDIGVFSLNQHKTITSGEGGWAITNDKDLALRMQLIRNHGEVIVENMEVEDISNIVGFNYRMTELEAAVGLEQFKKLDYLNKHRIELAEYLTKKLYNFNGLVLPKIDPSNKHVYFAYPILFKEEIIGISRDTFTKALKAEGIPCGVGYVRPIYFEPIYQKKSGYGKKGCPFTCGFYEGKVSYSKGICPTVERMHQKELFLLPVCKYPHTTDDMDQVVKAFEKIFGNIEELKTVGEKVNT